jgi:hypothetical protein
MKVPPVVFRARAEVGAFRRRLHEAEHSWSDDGPVDLLLLCELFLSCPVVPLEGLTDRAALHFLQTRYGFGAAGEVPSDSPLAGGLYLGRRGMPRWIFVERRDSPERQRFSIAHEIGHLVIEAEREIERQLGEADRLFDDVAAETIRRFSRCGEGTMAAMEEPGPPGGRPVSSSRTGAGRPVWTEADLREITANHFAAELLMPLEGVRRLIARETGAQGIRTDQDLERLVSAVASTYQVSHACARVRLVKDLGVVPVARSPNADLFG